jgi:hypothetical protein
VVVGSVLSVAFLFASGSLFWTLTSQYSEYSNASLGPALTASLTSLQVEHEQPVKVVPDPTVVALQTRSFASVPKGHRPAQDMIEHAVTQRLSNRGVVGEPAEAWTRQVPVLNEQVYNRKDAPPDSVEDVSTTLEQLRYSSRVRESLASSLLPKPAFELQQQLEQAAVVTEFAYPTVDVMEHSSSTETQTHNEVLERLTSATSLPNDLDPVDEEKVAVSTVFDNDYDNEVMGTVLQNQDPCDETDLQIMVSEHYAANMDPIVEETFKPAVSLPKCFALDRWNQTMLSDEASQEFVLWAHFGFWRRLFTSPTFAPLLPLQDSWPDFSANIKMMNFLTVMDPEYSIIPGKSCRSWDSLVDLVPSINRIEILQDAVGGRDDDDSHGDFFLRVPLVDLVGDFLRQKRQQMQKPSNYQYLEEQQPRVYT